MPHVHGDDDGVGYGVSGISEYLAGVFGFGIEVGIVGSGYSGAGVFGVSNIEDTTAKNLLAWLATARAALVYMVSAIT